MSRSFKQFAKDNAEEIGIFIGGLVASLVSKEMITGFRSAGRKAAELLNQSKNGTTANSQFLPQAEKKLLSLRQQAFEVSSTSAATATQATGKAAAHENVLTPVYNRAAKQGNDKKSAGYKVSTGGQEISLKIWEAQEKEATKMYQEFRNNLPNFKKIAESLNTSEPHAKRIYEHLFQKEHILPAGTSRFHADYEIGKAWQRAILGSATPADIKLFKHEIFESKFEGIFKTDYITAHKAANRAGYTSGLNETEEVIYGNRLN